MSKYTDDYERVVQELLKDPHSYDNWSDQSEEDDLSAFIDDSAWDEE